MKSKRYRWTLMAVWFYTGAYGLCAYFKVDLLPADKWVEAVMGPVYRLMFGGG